MKESEGVEKKGKDQGRFSSERLRMVERYRQSGLSRKAFAEAEGISVSTIDWWVRKARKSRKPAVVLREVEVALPGAGRESWAMEIESRDGLRVRCRKALQGAELLRLLRGCRC